MVVKRIVSSVVMVVMVTLGIFSSVQYSYADESELPEKEFLIYQLQTASLLSASSEFISIVNTSSKPQRLEGLCIAYSAATSENWLERACFNDTDSYTQLWIVPGGTAYVATSMFSTENPAFNADEVLSGSMAAGGGAVRLQRDSRVYDMLGWGTSINYETGASEAPSSGQILQRKISENALIDTDNNAQDFELLLQGIAAQSGVFEVEVPRDMCLNIEGVQETVPIGLEAEGENCYEDLCVNIDGLQSSLEGYEKIDGTCEEVQLESAVIVVTELFPNASGADGGKEFIELHNPNNRTIQLLGYKILADNKEYVLPEVDLPSQSYLALYDSETGIVLPNTNGVEVVIIDPAGDEVSRSELYSNAPDDQSWNLMAGLWQFSNQPTPNKPNKTSISSSIGGAVDEEVLAPCPEGKFRNPLTNRCKNIETTSSLVPCNANQVRNPLTNRCNNISSSSNTLKPCSAGQERNPATNRCRAIVSSNTLEPCPEGKERNPETNRCRTAAVLASADNGSGSALTATIVDVPAPSTGVNWAIISAAIIGSFVYIAYEWRMELAKAVATLRSYRYN